MELFRLRYFVEAADAGSISRASVRLGMTQPALGRQIQKLEEELRVGLFYRHGHGVALTESGQKLYASAKSLLLRMIELKEEILEQGDRPSGPVNLGIPPAIGATLAAPLAQSFQKACPNANLRIYESFSNTLLDWVESGQLDLAILYDARRGRNLIFSPLVLEDMYLVEPADAAKNTGALSVSELAGVELVLPGPEQRFRYVIDTAARRAGVALRVAMELDSVAALKQLVENGAGSTVLPFGAVHREVREGLLKARRIRSALTRVMLVAATPRRRPISKATRALLAIIGAEVKRGLATGMLKGQARTGMTRNAEQVTTARENG